VKIVHYVVDTDTPLATVLTALRADAHAVSEGRVFVGKTRALASTYLVPAGTTVAYTHRVEAAADVRILHQGDGLLVVDKPVGMPTIPDLHGKSHALVALAARAAGLPEKSLHPTSRLDRDVSGVVTFATTPAAQKLLAEARDRGTYERRYVALAATAPTPPNGTCEARIGRAKDPRHRKVDPHGEVACSRYLSVATAKDGKVTLLAFSPVTGRTHQLRVHASHLGAPLLGDKTYGGPTRLALGTGKILGLARIYLHCAGVRFPLAGTPSGVLSLRSEVPSALLEAWSALGGEASAWEVATAWDTAFG
jgi:23S rRNA-/tRNA-specific pseudouridylate synthase